MTVRSLHLRPFVVWCGANLVLSPLSQSSLLPSFSLSYIDLAIVAAYLCVVMAMGVFVGRRSNDLQSYLLGGRSMPWWAVLGSIVATETSTATFLSVPGIAFAANGDMTFLQLTFGYIIGRIIVSLVLLPLYFDGELFTAYEVLGKRFGGLTKRTASAIFLVTRNLGDGLRLFLTAIVLEKVTGFGLPQCVVMIGMITIAYTFVGGMKAVVWNDCLQFVVYILGGAVALWLIIDALPGGWQQFTEFGKATAKFRVVDWQWNWSAPFTIWSGVIGGAVLTLGTHGADQMMVHRYLCTRGQREASLALVLSGFVVCLQFAFFLLIGIALACFYDVPGNSRVFDRNDEVFATFIVQEMPIGLVGLTLAAVFSAAMSTLSSSLHSSASSALNDLMGRGEKTATKNSGVWTTRMLIITFGVIQIIVGIGAVQFSRSVVGDALAIAGFSAGLLLGVFLLGVAMKNVGQTAALCGMILGLAILTGVHFGTDIAWPWYAVIGAVTTFATATFAQLMLPSDYDKKPSKAEND